MDSPGETHCCMDSPGETHCCMDSPGETHCCTVRLDSPAEWFDGVKYFEPATVAHMNFLCIISFTWFLPGVQQVAMEPQVTQALNIGHLKSTLKEQFYAFC